MLRVMKHFFTITLRHGRFRSHAEYIVTFTLTDDKNLSEVPLSQSLSAVCTSKIIADQLKISLTSPA